MKVNQYAKPIGPRMITPEFEIFSKSLYMAVILNELKKDPGLWETFSTEKQIELHAIKKELDEKFKKEVKA